jgi:hypothetical protein
MNNVTSNIVKNVEKEMRKVSINDPSMDTAVQINKFKDDVTEEETSEEMKDGETTEATSSSSAGAYVTNAWVAPNKKNWRGASKPQIPGGKFVQIKKKCSTFPYCNQGDINALKIYENETVKNAISNLSTKLGLNENVIKAIIQHELEQKKNKRVE